MILVPLAAPTDWARVLADLQQMGAAMLPLGGATPRALTEVPVEFTHEGERFARARGRVVQLMGDKAAVSFEPGEVRRLAQVDFPAVAAPPAPPPDEDDSEDALEEDEEERRPRAEGESPLWARYGEMSKVEKMHLARKGGPDARRMIFRDRDRTLQAYVLNNPGLTANELATLIKLATPDREMIKRILAIQQFAQSPKVCFALVRSPHTPIKTAVELVPRLTPMVVRRIAKDGNLRPEVVAAARRRVARGR
ncbi:MAG: hypothetical protein H6741_34260 [Alphaproteobacteria bacterium]|nr:hypothetical protein [Alphaproteobacteria bacterium]